MLRDPAMIDADGAGTPLPRLVNTWITPPTAFEPYRLETLPRTISTRSTWSSMMCCRAVKLNPASSMRTPSIRISVRAVLAPRSESGEGTAPMPPVCAISNPASLRSRVGRSTACESRISFSVRTVVCGIASRRRCWVREAVTTTASSWANTNPGISAMTSAARNIGSHAFPRQASPHAGKPIAPVGRYPGLRGLTRLPLRGQHRLPWARPRLRFLFPV